MIKKKTVGEESREEILQSLISSYPDGKSTLQLASDTGLTRFTIRNQCKELKENTLIYREREKDGKYYLTQIALGAPNLQGYWFEKIAHDSLISRYTSPASTIKAKLYALVTTLGVYNTYVMIEAALEQDFHPFVGTEISGIQKKSYKKILGSRQGPDRDNLVKTSVEGAIHPAQMLLQLCRLVIAKEELDRYGSNIWPLETPAPWATSGSLFEENRTVFEALKKAFTDLYPEDIRQLEKIRKEQAGNAARSQLELFRNWKKQQQRGKTRKVRD